MNGRLSLLVMVAGLVMIAGYLVWQNRALSQKKTLADIGLGLRGVTPEPTPEPGKVALTDVNELIKGNENQSSNKPTRTIEGGVIVQDIIIGTGTEALPGTGVLVHYEGLLESGQMFDNSYDRKQPFEFVIGAGQVIKGWEVGLVGMKVGGKRNLVIPPEMAYGAKGAGGVIPPNATLRFNVELLDVKAVK